MKTNHQTPKNKAYVLGLSIGTSWLIAASTGFAIFSIAGMNGARYAIIPMLAIGGTLLAATIRQMVGAVKLRSEPPSPDRRRIGRYFGLIFGLEILGVMVVNTACALTGHLSLIVPLDLIIVGLHFLPLARLFGVPRYTTLGILFCTVSVLTLLLVPANAQIGASLARFVCSTLGCAFCTWFVSAGNVSELRRLLRSAPPRPV